MDPALNPNALPDSLRPSDEEANKPRTPRVLQACKQCRDRKQRCNGLDPCQACKETGQSCVYVKIKTKTNDESLRRIAETTETTLKEVRALTALLNPPNEPCSTGPLHCKSLAISQDNYPEFFSSQKLGELSDSYMGNVHVLHPIFDKPREMCETFIKEYSDTATARRDSIIPSLHNAIVLLFFALGSCKSFSDSPKPSSIIPGMAYYFRAQDILAHKHEKYSTSFAQAMTLAALYTNQIGNLQESWLHISCAYSLYKQHGYYRSVPNDVSTVRSQNNPISEETKRGSWICRELERGINALLNIVSSDLIPISGSNTLPVESPEEVPEMFCANRALLQTLLEEVQKLTPTGFAENTTTDKEDLTYLTNAANSQHEYLKIWRSGLPSSLAWEDRKPPSIDPLMASLQAEFYNGIAKLLRPYLEIIRKCERFAGTLNKLSAGQRGLIGVVESWIQGALSSIVAFDRIGAVSDGVYEEYRSTNKIPIVLSNPVKTLHVEFENVLILHAVYFSAIYPSLSNQTKLTETSLKALRFRTIDRLSGFWPESPLLTRDLKMLGMLEKGDSVPLLELARIMTG